MKILQESSYSVLKKGILSVLFLLCFSCTSKAAPEWQLAKTLSSYSPCYNFARLHFPVENISDGLEIELDHTMSGLRMYVNVFSITLKPAPIDCSSFPVKLKKCEEEKVFEGTLLQGNQRVLLPAEAKEYFIQGLLEGSDIEVTAGRYKGFITADNFCKLYNEFISIPLP